MKKFNNWKSKSALSACLLTVTSGAFAALPTAATDAITAINTDGLALIDAIWIPVAAIVGGFILIKLFKRGASKV